MLGVAVKHTEPKVPLGKLFDKFGSKKQKKTLMI